MQPITVSTPYKSERIHLDLVCLNIAVALCLKDSHLRYIFVGVPGFEPGKESELQRLPPYQLGYTPVVDELVITASIRSVVRTLSPKSCCPIRGSRVGFFISHSVFTGSQRPYPQPVFYL